MSDLSSQAEADEATFLRTGEWIMVTALAPTVPQAIAAGPPPPPHVEVNFFRVLSVGRRVFPDQGNVWRRRIRLAGSNWTVPNTVGASGTGPIAPGYGVIIDGAVAVYRKNLVYDSMGMLSP
ncbi:MAG: hypothetical protein JNM18_23770 [Planctomycetaceae bacterium]|nr:hypothetical protein [Planctomycetaceae bacterium]